MHSDGLWRSGSVLFFLITVPYDRMLFHSLRCGDRCVVCALAVATAAPISIATVLLLFLLFFLFLFFLLSILFLPQPSGL